MKEAKSAVKILYTCFKGKNNASFQLVSEICGDKLYLTNPFDGLKRDIANQSEEYDFVIMFGIDKNLKNRIRIERVAEYNGVVARTKADVENMKIRFDDTEISCTISDKPTQYLCNAAYFHMLQKMGGKAVFIHIPTVKNVPEDMMAEIRECVYASTQWL